MMEPFVPPWGKRDTGSAAAGQMPLGPMSLQPDRALTVLGYDPATVDPSIKKEVVESLIHDHAFTIYVCAKHLSDLRDPFFAAEGACDWVDGDIVLFGAQSGFGPEQPGEILRKGLSCGQTIVERRVWLGQLLSCAPFPRPSD
jgi:hypothetical protein